MVDGFTALDRLFRARGVCVVGASEDPRKLASRALANLVRHRYAGALYAVNPKYRTLGGVPCVPSVEDLPGAIDVALVGVPAAAVPDVVEACGRRGVAAAVVISSGFEETASGGDLAARLAQAARRHGVAVVGPNCEGVWSVRERLLLTFGSAADRDVLHEGPIAVVSQSGAVGGAAVRHLQDAGYGCAQFVSAGNETVLTCLDYLEYLVEQDDLRVIALFVEALKDGRRLLGLAERARRHGIEIVALKAGGSRLGREATVSHTGKIASDDAVYRAVFAEAGVLEVESLVDLVEAAALLSWCPPPRIAGNRPGVGVLSIPGGTRALTADLAERAGVPLATFDEATVSRLAAILPPFGYPRNPADVTGEVLNRPDLLEGALGVVAADPSVEAALVQFANGGPRDARARRDLLSRVAREGALPVVAGFLGDAMPAEERRGFAADGVLVARDPSEAVRSLAWLYRRREHMALPLGAPAPERAAAWPFPATWTTQVALLAGAGIPVPPWVRVAPGEDVAAVCGGLRFPVVVKALPETADHKTELGLVALGLGDGRAAAAAARDIWGRMPAPVPLLVQEMVSGGLELLVSVTRDPDFGPLVALGVGGTLVEVVAEVGYLLAPAEPGAVRRLLGRLPKVSRLLAGVRGAPPRDVEALVEAVVRLGRLFVEVQPRCAELELNPLFVLPKGQGVVAVDVLAKEAV